MFDVGGGEFLLIVIAVLVLFGPKKIPEVAQMIGKGMRKVRQAQAQFQSQLNELQNEIKTATDFEPHKEIPYQSKPDFSNPSSHIDSVYDNYNRELEKENLKEDGTSTHNSLSNDVTHIYPEKPLEH